MADRDLHDLAKKAGGRFKLSTLVHRRMKQLTDDGYRPTSSGKLLRTAIGEVRDGAVTMVPTAADALLGAGHILAERIANDPRTRLAQQLRDTLLLVPAVPRARRRCHLAARPPDRRAAGGLGRQPWQPVRPGAGALHQGGRRGRRF